MLPYIILIVSHISYIYHPITSCLMDNSFKCINLHYVHAIEIFYKEQDKICPSLFLSGISKVHFFLYLSSNSVLPLKLFQPSPCFRLKVVKVVCFNLYCFDTRVQKFFVPQHKNGQYFQKLISTCGEMLICSWSERWCWSGEKLL